MLTTKAIWAFLDVGHQAWWGRVAGFAADTLRARTEPADDAAGRNEARALLGIMGEAGVLDPIGSRDLRACCLARESIASASPLADAVWALQGLGATPLLLAAEDDVRDRWVSAALDGKAMLGFAMTEREAGSDVASMRTRAVRDGAEYVLDGGKWLISNAGVADAYVVFATTDPERRSRGISAFLVPAETPGLSFVGAQVMSAPHPLGELTLEACRVPAAHRIGGEGEGFKVGMATLDQLRPTVGAAACGMAGRAVEEALGHAIRRKQFGRPLADFQLVQEKLGGMAIELDAARMLVYRAAFDRDESGERITKQAAMAKAYATEAAQRIIDQAVQIIGGRGVLADHPVDLLYRSVRALRISEGSTEIQHLLVARTLIADARAAADREEDA